MSIITDAVGDGEYREIVGGRLMAATQEQNAYLSRVFGVPAPLLPSLPTPPRPMPPPGLLARAGDGGLYWHPNPVMAISAPAPASAEWIDGFLQYYWLEPVATGPDFRFNRAPSDLDALATLAADQAALAGWVAAPAVVKAAALKIVNQVGEAQFNGQQFAESESVLQEEDLALLSVKPMVEILATLEELRSAAKLDGVSRRARNRRLRLGALSVMHDLGKEWSELMRHAFDDDQAAVRKYVYRHMVAGDDKTGPAPPVDPPEKGDERRLTGTEVSYVDQVFQGSIDYSKVRIVKGGLLTLPSHGRTIGNTIHLPTNAFNEGTLELSSAPESMRLLVHELTHVWQYQHGDWTYAPMALLAMAMHPWSFDNWEKAAKSGASFEDLNPEAQGYAIGDYNAALRAVNSGSATREDYKTLKLLKPWVATMIAGPKQ